MQCAALKGAQISFIPFCSMSPYYSIQRNYHKTDYSQKSFMRHSCAFLLGSAQNVSTSIIKYYHYLYNRPTTNLKNLFPQGLQDFETKTELWSPSTTSLALNVKQCARRMDFGKFVRHLTKNQMIYSSQTATNRGCYFMKHNYKAN